MFRHLLSVVLLESELVGALMISASGLKAIKSVISSTRRLPLRYEAPSRRQEGRVHTPKPSKRKCVLISKGARGENAFNLILQEIDEEIKRRKALSKDQFDRRMFIEINYKPLHPDIYELKEEFLHKDFLLLVQFCKHNPDADVQDLSEYIHTESGDRIYSFPVFTKTFCDRLMEEICYFEDSDCPKGRPNTMNQYGVLLNELGFDDKFFNPLREKYLQPLAAVLFPDWGGDCLNSHKVFIVKYKMGEDLDLKYHYDNAEVTLNVSLGKEFQGGSLYFGAMRTVPLEETEYSEYTHKPAIGILHRGQHRHGASAITLGERYNLIVWMRSSNVRNVLCPMCNSKPDLVESYGFGDGFTRQCKQVDVCATV